MSLLAPLGLLAAALAIPLISLYFLKLRRERVVVPSLLHWRALAKSERLASPFDKFKRNLLLWIQLLLLALLALALARPAADLGWGGGASMVLVVDVSASMAATDGAPTRLDSAIEQAEGVLAGLSAQGEATLVAAGPQTQVVVPFTQEPGRVRAALRELRATQAPASLREGVQLALSLARARSGVQVHVFSDGGGGSLADLPTGDTDVRYHRIGEPSGNAGIVALDLRASPSSELARQLFVTAQRFGEPVQGTVRVTLDERPLGQRNVELGTAPVSLVFDLPPGAAGVLRAELRADDDHLELDDTAYAIVEPVRRRRVIAVGTDSLTTRAIASDPRVHLLLRRPQELTAQEADLADALIVAEPVALDLNGRNVAYLGPESQGPATLGDAQPRPEVLSWQRTHPVLRLAMLDRIQIAELHTLQNNGGLTPIVSTTAGPMILAGERGGGRVVQIVVEPVRSDLPLRVAWPVVLLNAVGWLTEGRGGVDHGHVLRAGQPWSGRVRDGASVQVTGPGGQHPAFTVKDALLRVQDTLTLGVYRVDVAGVRQRFAVNLQAPGESDLAPRGALDLGESARAGSVAQASVGGPQELWRWFAIAALLVLGVEWIVWTRRSLR